MSPYFCVQDIDSVACGYFTLCVKVLYCVGSLGGLKEWGGKW